MLPGAEGSAAPEYRLFNFMEYVEALAHIRKYARTGRRAGRGENFSYNDIIFTADTETSKTRADQFDDKGRYLPGENIVVAWTVTAAEEAGNICTVYGSKPSDLCVFLYELHETLEGEKTYIFFHNLSYDWSFLELFLFQFFDYPIHQLNTKPHYPVSIEFQNGLILRDSLIIAQERLEKWAVDLDVEHKKAVGKWDYEKIRDQSGVFTADELMYIEQDTLALAECLIKLMNQLHKHVYSIPMTCTSILREETRKIGRQNRARDRFRRVMPSYDFYIRKLLPGYHGGYVHNNRHAAGWIWNDRPTAYDFASSYPFRILVDDFPKERFRRLPDQLDPSEILENAGSTAFIFNFYAENIELKDHDFPMPSLQLSKCIKSYNAITDNGRITAADAVDIVLTEIDLKIIYKFYKWTGAVCYDVYAAAKGPLPDWFRKMTYNLFYEKTMKKGGDPVDYSLAKAKLNSLYGMTVQRSIRPEITEDYKSGEYTIEESESREDYQKYLDNENSILPYFWGVWVTAYAMEALFDLGDCVGASGVWLYSDTDSVYACGWDSEKVDAYNQKQKARLSDSGFGPVLRNGREYWPGIAELDGEYQEFIGLHAKCYAVRKTDGDIKITVAGVPKRGAICLENDLSNFQDGFIFPGEVTGKLTHFYLYRPEPVIENGIEKGNSVDLHACDYVISQPTLVDFFKVLGEDEIEMQVYDNE